MSATSDRPSKTTPRGPYVWRLGSTPKGGWSQPDPKFNIEVVDKDSDWTTVRITPKSQDHCDD